MGLTLNKTGRATEAEALLRESLDIRTWVLGKKHYFTAFTHGVLGDCLTLQGRYAEAEPLLKDACFTLTSVQKEGGPLAIKAAHRLEAFYAAWGKPQEAAQYLRPSLAEQTRSVDYPNMFSLRSVLVWFACIIGSSMTSWQAPIGEGRHRERQVTSSAARCH